MCLGRLQRWIFAVALVGALGITRADAGPLAVVANFTDPGAGSGPPWPPGTVSIIDTATDQLVGAPIRVGVNPSAVAITPDGKMAVVACMQSSDLYFIDLTANPPKIIGDKLVVGSGSGDTFYPAGLAMDPDGLFVAVTGSVGSQTQKSTQIKNILLIKLRENDAQKTISIGRVQTLSLDTEDPTKGFTAEAAAISPKGSVVIVGPSATPLPVIFALGYDKNGEIVLPEPDDNTTQLGVFQNQTGLNVTLSPDGSYALVPSGGPVLDLFNIQPGGKMTIGGEHLDSGGNGSHSVAISPDGKTAYVRNLTPPRSNIAVFQINPGPQFKDTGLRLNCPGLPEVLVAYAGYTANSFGHVGSQMLAVTPDGKKIYAANPYGGPPTAANQFLYGDGNVLVFEAGKAAPVKTLNFGKNPIAVAIQAK